MDQVMLCVVGLLILLPASVWAQDSPSEWSSPEELSRSITFSKSPKAVVDMAGGVHLFWAENNGEDQSNRGAPDAIFYSWWDGENWSEPVDVVAGEEIGQVSVSPLCVLVDREGFLHLFWSKRSAVYSSGLYWSIAHIAFAEGASAWSTQLLMSGSVYDADAKFDSQGVLHLVYSDEARTIKYSYLSDRQGVWSSPANVYQEDSEELAVSGPRIAVDAQGLVHVTWQQSSSADGWNPVAVFYSRFTDAGATWLDPVQWGGPGRRGEPNVAVDGDGHVHIVWSRSIGSEDGRYHVWSDDAGQMWREPTALTFGSGFTGSPSLVIDGSGRLHLATGVGDRTGTPVIHSVWGADAWSEPHRIPGPGGEGACLVIRGGREALVFWFSPGDGQIYFSQAFINAEVSAFQPVPNPPIIAATSSPAVEIVMDGTPTPSPTAESSATGVPTSQETFSALPTSASRSQGAILWGIAPAILLIILVMIVYLRFRR